MADPSALSCLHVFFFSPTAVAIPCPPPPHASPPPRLPATSFLPSRSVARVAVVDFDVHHGNGTQDVLCRTQHPGFLYASIHAFNRGGGDGSQARIFPGTGAAGEGHENVLNIPLGEQVRAGVIAWVSAWRAAPPFPPPPFLSRLPRLFHDGSLMVGVLW